MLRLHKTFPSACRIAGPYGKAFRADVPSLRVDEHQGKAMIALDVEEKKEPCWDPITA